MYRHTLASLHQHRRPMSCASSGYTLKSQGWERQERDESVHSDHCIDGGEGEAPLNDQFQRDYY